jgi:hypothetical protein
MLYTYNYDGVSPETQSYVRSQLRKAELCIKRRSIAIENKWTCDKLKQAPISLTQSKILTILECLDKYCYDLSDINETINTLYNEIFPKLKTTGDKSSSKAGSQADKSNGSQMSGNINGDGGEGGDKLDDEADRANGMWDYEDEENDVNKPLSDQEIIHLLCEWSTTTKRTGLHRIFYAVFLIKKRQIDYINRFKEEKQFIKNVRI